MTQAELLELFDAEARRDLVYPDMVKEATPQLTRFLRPAPGMSHVLYSRLDEASADAAIAAEVAYFAARGLPFVWKLYEHDRPPDLGARLEAQGFTPDEREAVMALPLAEAPAALLEPPRAEVRRLERPEELEAVIAVEERVWGGSFAWMRERLGGHMAVPGYLSVFVAYAGGEPASCGWTYYPEGSRFASLWGGSTVPERRAQGLYRALLAARAQEALSRARRYLVVDAGPMSRPILARHGFRVLTHARDYRGPRPDRGLPQG